MVRPGDGTKPRRRTASVQPPTLCGLFLIVPFKDLARWDDWGREVQQHEQAEQKGKPKHIHILSEFPLSSIDPELVATLKRYLVWLKEFALKRGWGEPKWLFPDDDGRPIDEPKARKLLKRTLRKSGLPLFHRLYDLRYTFGSILLAEGAPITYVSEQMRHANPTTTLRFYARYVPTKGRRWVNVLDSGAIREPKSGTEVG